MWDTSLDLFPNSHGTVRKSHECFGKSLFGRNLLLMIRICSSFHRTLDSPPMKGYLLVYSEYIKGSRSSHMLMYGEMSAHFV